MENLGEAAKRLFFKSYKAEAAMRNFLQIASLTMVVGTGAMMTSAFALGEIPPIMCKGSACTAPTPAPLAGAGPLVWLGVGAGALVYFVARRRKRQD